MIYLDLSNKNKYHDVCSYLMKECDEVSFHFPILDKEAYHTSELAQDYMRYECSKRELLKEFFNHGATRTISKIYQGIHLGYETQIIRVKLYPELMDRLKNHHLYDWVWWNALPEDPCFFSNNICRFVTISHEEIFYMCDEKKDFSLVEQMKK